MEMLEDITDLDHIQLEMLIIRSRNDGLTVGEIAETGKIDRGKAYRALEILKGLGFVKTTMNNPIHVSLVDGDEIMSALEARLNNDVTQKIDGYLMLINYLEETRVKKDIQAEEFTITRGTQNIWAQLSRRLKSAKEEVILLVSGDEFRRMSHSAIYEILEKLDCKITIITEPGEYDLNSDNTTFLPNTAGIQGKILLIDDSFVMFGKDGQKYNDPNDNCAATNNVEIVNQYRTLLNSQIK